MSFTFITPTDFVECFNEAAAERIAPGLQEHFIDYLPSMTRQDFKQQCPLIQRRSLPSIMTATHSLHLQPLEIRRKSCLLKTIDMNLCLLTPVVENIVIYSFSFSPCKCTGGTNISSHEELHWQGWQNLHRLDR